MKPDQLPDKVNRIGKNKTNRVLEALRRAPGAARKILKEAESAATRNYTQENRNERRSHQTPWENLVEDSRLAVGRSGYLRIDGKVRGPWPDLFPEAVIENRSPFRRRTSVAFGFDSDENPEFRASVTGLIINHGKDPERYKAIGLSLPSGGRSFNDIYTNEEISVLLLTNEGVEESVPIQKPGLGTPSNGQFYAATIAAHIADSIVECSKPYILDQT